MRENRTSGSEGGEAQTNELSLPLSLAISLRPQCRRTLRGPIRSNRRGAYHLKIVLSGTKRATCLSGALSRFRWSRT